MQNRRSAVALLITAMFVILISIAIGYSLKQINEASKYVEHENNMYQNFIFVEDVLNILKNSKELQELANNEAPEELYTFLTTSGFLTFEHSGVRLVLHISSARDKFDINTMSQEQEAYLYEYLSAYNVRGEFVDILKDASSGIKEDNYYNTVLFDKDPDLFRDYIASSKHLEKLIGFYENIYKEESIEDANLSNLFYFGANNQNSSADQNISIDLNYATAQVWQLMLGVDQDTAQTLGSGENFYTSIDAMTLSEEQKKRLEKFNTSFFEPFLNIKIDIIKDNLISHVSFEYDIKNKKGYNFVYEI